MGSLNHKQNATGVEHGVEILDIRVNKDGHKDFLKDEIWSGMQKKTGEKTLPTMLLYDSRGLKLFEEITYMDEYYLTNTEISILEKYSGSMAEGIEDGGVLIELGSGNLRKVNILLRALDRLGKKITYYALDLDRSELVRTLLMVPPGTFKNIRCVGLHGTYDDGLAWLNSAVTTNHKCRCILWLGSSAGNLSLSGIASFFREWAVGALRAGKPDLALVSLDGCKIPEKVQLAYSDPKGISRDFALNALWHANNVLGREHFIAGEWESISVWNAEEGRQESYLVALKDIAFDGDFRGLAVEKGERINLEYSYKFGNIESRVLWSQSGLVEGAQWANDAGDYRKRTLDLHMLYKPEFIFPLGPSLEYAANPAPTVSEWKELWASWDIVTLKMIPKEKLLTIPIDLRNPCIFYIGHVPVFLDLHITRATGDKMTGLCQKYQEFFQRGIDPDVDDPTQCHNHSTVPGLWPDLEEILNYSLTVRERTLALYDNAGSADGAPVRLQRALWLSFEHQAMHLETFLYMLLQSDYILPPPGVIMPDFTSSSTWEKRGKTNTEDEDNAWVVIPKRVIDIGMDDPEDDLENDLEEGINGIHSGHPPSNRYFGWDNEKPLRRGVEVPGFKVRSYPITNEEYAKYLHTTSSMSIPASWTFSAPKINGANGKLYKNETATNGNVMNEASSSFEEFLNSYSVKTVFGLVPLKFSCHWPAIASYNELSGCAAWIGGRIPTADEVRAVYDYAELMEVTEKTLGRRIDVINGHLTNNGVRESPPHIESLFADLRGCNVGFKNWHPTSVRFSGNGAPLGRCATGGAWEWTSTVLERHEGFKEMKLYPEYTADFFGGKHNVMLGGSWATHPRIAGRRSFINWYQRNYRYTWATARIAALE